MPTFRDIVGYRPSQARRILRQLNNQLNPTPSRQSQPSQTSQPLFPGGQIRELWNLPHTPAPPLQPINTTCPELLPSEPVECAPTMPEVSGSIGPNRPQYTQFARDPEPEVEIDPVVAAPDPEPQGLGSRILRAVWAPKAVPGSAPSSGVSTLPVRQAGPEAARPSKPRRPRPKRPRIRKKPVRVHASETISPEIADKGDITLAHHSARCSICNHPDCEAIEQAFLHWTRPSVIAYEFNLGSRLAVYRHAHALGLFHRRNLQTQHALGYLVEQAQSVKPTADSIIRAVKALSCFDDAGRYHEPRKEVLITHQVVNVITPTCPEADTTSRRACPDAATSGPTLPAHSYSIAPVGTGDSPLHLRLDSLQLDEAHSFTQRQPEAVEGFTQSQPHAAGEPLPNSAVAPAVRVRSDSPLATSHSPLYSNLIDTHDEQKPDLTPMDPVT